MVQHDEILTRYTGDVSGFLKATQQYDRRLAELDGSVQSRLNRVDARWQRSGRVMEGLRGTVSRLALGVSLAEFGRQAIMTAGEFEASMNRIRAASGAGQEELVALAARARELGQSTAFSASEAADAAEVLVRNGVSVGDILDGALQSSLRLASATGGSLARSADLATDIMAQFGLAARDLAEVADIVAGAAVNSKFSFDDLAGAIGQGGAVAAQAGVDFSEYATALAATAQAFTSGSDAGTSFKTFVLSLSGNSKQAREEIARLGLEFYDAAGNLRPMREIAGELQRAISGLSQEASATSLKTIFGTDAIRTAAAMAETGADGFDRLSEAIGKVSAAEQAEARMTGLEGAMKRAAAAWEGLLLSFGEAGGLDAATAAVDTFAAAITGVSDILPELAVAAGAVAGGRGIAALTRSLGAAQAAAMENVRATETHLTVARAEVAQAQENVVARNRKLAVLRQLSAATGEAETRTRAYTRAERAAVNSVRSLNAATEAATRAEAAHAAALARSTVQKRLATSAAGALRAGMAFFGGPVGLAVTGISVGIGYLANNMASASSGADGLSDNMIGLESAVQQVRTAQEAYSTAIADTRQTQTDASRQIVAATRAEYDAKLQLLGLELKRQRTAQEDRRTRLGEVSAEASDTAAQIARLEDRRRHPARWAADRETGRIAQLKAELDALRDEETELQARITLSDLQIADAEKALETPFSATVPEGGEGRGPAPTGAGAGADAAAARELLETIDTAASRIEALREKRDQLKAGIASGLLDPDEVRKATDAVGELDDRIRSMGSAGGGGGVGSAADTRGLAEILAMSSERIVALKEEARGVRDLGVAEGELAERARLLAEARRAGIDLTARAAEGGRTYAEVIDAQAAAYGRAQAEVTRLQQAEALYRETSAALMSAEDQRADRVAKIEALRPEMIRLVGDEERANTVLAEAIKRVNTEYDTSADKGRAMAETVGDAIMVFADSSSSALEKVLGLVGRLVSAGGADFFGALFGSGGGEGLGAALGSAVRGAFGFEVATGHSGAVIGQVASGSTTVDPRVFAGAPRYHDGGLLGLKHGEVPFIGKVGEPIFPDIESAAAFGQAPRGGDRFELNVYNPTGSMDEMQARMRAELTGALAARDKRDRQRRFTDPRRFG